MSPPLSLFLVEYGWLELGVHGKATQLWVLSETFDRFYSGQILNVLKDTSSLLIYNDSK